MLQSSILHDILSGTKENIVIAIKYFEYFCNIVEIFCMICGNSPYQNRTKNKATKPKSGHV